MSRVEGYFVLSKHVDVLGTCKGPGDTVLVTLEKGGVIQYNTSTQDQVKSWALGGSSTRKISCNAVYLHSKQGEGAKFAAIVQERKRKHLYLWNQSDTSVSAGTKYSLNTSERSFVVAIGNDDKGKGQSQCFLVLSYDGTLAKLEPGAQLTQLEVTTVPEDSKILDIKVCYEGENPCICYLYELDGKQKICACRLVSSGKVPATEVSELGEAQLDQFGSAAIKILGFQNGKATLLGEDNGSLAVVDVDSWNSGVAEIGTICTVNNLISPSSVSFTPTQIALIGVEGKDNKSSRIVINVMDVEYKLLLHEYIANDGGDLSLSKGESLVGVNLLDSETILVSTNKKQVCFKFFLSEMNFSDVLGTLKEQSTKNKFVDFELTDSSCATITTVPADIGLEDPKSKQYYGIYEHLDAEISKATSCMEMNDFSSCFKGSLKSSKTFLAKLKEILQPSSQGVLPLFSESFVSKLWEECIRLKSWDGIHVLLSHKVCGDSSHCSDVLKKLLLLSQFEHFRTILRIPPSYTEDELCEIIRAVLGQDLSNGGVQTCLMSIVLRSNASNMETTTSAVKKLSMDEVIALISFLHSELKSEVTNDGKANKKKINSIVLFVSSIIDAHLTTLLLSEESHQLIESLHAITNLQVQSEKNVGRLAKYIKDLESIEPLQEQGHTSSKDFAVEILNISVS